MDDSGSEWSASASKSAATDADDAVNGSAEEVGEIAARFSLGPMTRVLSAACAGLSDEDGAALLTAARLCASSGLQRASLSRNALGVQSARAAGRLAAAGVELSSLRLDGNVNIGDVGCASLASCLRRSACLRHLDVSGCGITGAGASEFASLIARGRSRLPGGPRGTPSPALLQSLTLGGNAIGDDGARSLATALRSPACRLRALDLHFTSIGPQGCQALAEALSADLPRSCQPSLTELVLRGNPIEDHGGRAMAEVIAVAGTRTKKYPKVAGALNTLDLGDCNITDFSAGPLAAALRARANRLTVENPSLTLVLSQNPGISAGGCVLLLAAANCSWALNPNESMRFPRDWKDETAASSPDTTPVWSLRLRALPPRPRCRVVLRACGLVPAPVSATSASAARVVAAAIHRLVASSDSVDQSTPSDDATLVVAAAALEASGLDPALRIAHGTRIPPFAPKLTSAASSASLSSSSSTSSTSSSEHRMSPSSTLSSLETDQLAMTLSHEARKDVESIAPSGRDVAKFALGRALESVRRSSTLSRLQQSAVQQVLESDHPDTFLRRSSGGVASPTKSPSLRRSTIHEFSSGASSPTKSPSLRRSSTHAFSGGSSSPTKSPSLRRSSTHAFSGGSSSPTKSPSLRRSSTHAFSGGSSSPTKSDPPTRPPPTADRHVSFSHPSDHQRVPASSVSVTRAVEVMSRQDAVPPSSPHVEQEESLASMFTADAVPPSSPHVEQEESLASMFAAAGIGSPQVEGERQPAHHSSSPALTSEQSLPPWQPPPELPSIPRIWTHPRASMAAEWTPTESNAETTTFFEEKSRAKEDEEDVLSGEADDLLSGEEEEEGEHLLSGEEEEEGEQEKQQKQQNHQNSFHIKDATRSNKVPMDTPVSFRSPGEHLTLGDLFTSPQTRLESPPSSAMPSFGRLRHELSEPNRLSSATTSTSIHHHQQQASQVASTISRQPPSTVSRIAQPPPNLDRSVHTGAPFRSSIAPSTMGSFSSRAPRRSFRREWNSSTAPRPLPPAPSSVASASVRSHAIHPIPPVPERVEYSSPALTSTTTNTATRTSTWVTGASRGIARAAKAAERIASHVQPAPIPREPYCGHGATEPLAPTTNAVIGGRESPRKPLPQQLIPSGPPPPMDNTLRPHIPHATMASPHHGQHPQEPHHHHQYRPPSPAQAPSGPRQSSPPARPKHRQSLQTDPLDGQGNSFGGGGAPQTRTSFGGDAPQTRTSFGGDAPQTRMSFGGDAPQTRTTFGGGAPQTRTTFGGDAPPQTRMSFGGAAPPTKKALEPPPPTKTYTTAPPPSNHFPRVQEESKEDREISSRSIPLGHALPSGPQPSYLLPEESSSTTPSKAVRFQASTTPSTAVSSTKDDSPVGFEIKETELRPEHGLEVRVGGAGQWRPAMLQLSPTNGCTLYLMRSGVPSLVCTIPHHEAALALHVRSALASTSLALTRSRVSKSPREAHPTRCTFRRRGTDGRHVEIQGIAIRTPDPRIVRDACFSANIPIEIL